MKAMNKIKRFGAMSLAGMLLMGALAGCGNSSANDSKTDSDSTAAGSTASGAIDVVSREDGSGTRGAFIELFGIETKDASGNKTDNTTSDAIIANQTEVMMQNVQGDENAIGYASLGSMSDSVKAVKIDGAEATTENVLNGSYKISRPFNVATKSDLSAAAQDFLNYILSADGQKIISDNGYIPVDDKAQAYQAGSASGDVTVAGSSSVTPVMEKLKEAYEGVNKNVKITVQESDSTTGMTSASEGTCDIGMASRELKDSEVAAGVRSQPIARDGIAVIVAPSSSVDELTSQQVKDVFSGVAKTWADVIG